MDEITRAEDPSAIEQPTIDTDHHRSFLIWGFAGSLILFLIALGLGILQGRITATLSVIASAALFEVVVGAAGSIPMGFDPFTGALIAALANLTPVPILITMFDTIMRKWKWLHKRIGKSEKWSNKYGKFGVWILAALSPFLGAYVCVAIGIGLRWRPILIFASITLGVMISSFLTTFGGSWMVDLFGGHR